MRMVATAALTLAVTATANAQQPWVWWDAACNVRMESWPDRPFRISSADRRYSTECEITDWPISSLAATMMCGEGAKAQIETNDDTGVVKLVGLPVTATAGTMLYPSRGAGCGIDKGRG